VRALDDRRANVVTAGIARSIEGRAVGLGRATRVVEQRRAVQAPGERLVSRRGGVDVFLGLRTKIHPGVAATVTEPGR